MDDIVQWDNGPGRPPPLVRRNIWCRMFRRTLLDDANGRYRGLPPHNINAFEDLKRLFRVAFAFHTRRKKGITTLLGVS